MESPIEYPNQDLTKEILKHRGFRVTFNNVPKSKVTLFGRRHYYLIILSIGESKVYYDNRVFHLDGVYLFLANPQIPYATEIISENQQGYSCVFSDNFIKPISLLDSLQNSALFHAGEIPIFKLDSNQQAKLTGYFDAMIANETTTYRYKDDLMRTYIQLIIHEALHLRPADLLPPRINSSFRITTDFKKILESQFPVEHMDTPLKIKIAQEYADKLAIHVNSLNRAVKEITGKSTTTIIAERIVAEAKSLLQYTDWSVADIAFALGFEYANYFSNFFKKMTGNTPKSYRRRDV